jgi:hypothetical protein
MQDVCTLSGLSGYQLIRTYSIKVEVCRNDGKCG